MQHCETILESRVESVSRRFYEIADRLVSVETDTDWTARLAAAFFSGLHLSPSSGRDHGPAHLLLRIMTGPPPPTPAKPERFKVPGGVCYKNHQSYDLEVKGSRIAVGAKDSKQVSVWLGNTAVARSRGSLITVMAYAVPAALRRIGVYDLHAAALIEPKSGWGFLFPGPSRSGKSSLSLRLAASGWRYLSDDLVVITEVEAGVEVRGLRRPFQTSDDSLAGHDLPRLDDALGVTIPNDLEKRRLDPEILFPGQFAASSRPVVLCFPVITGEAQTRLEETAKAEAMMRLIDMCPWSNYDSSAAPDHLRVLSHLVRQCRTFTLHAGRDVFDEPHGASALLSRLAKEV
jgi:hypothetical protein